MQSSMTFFSTLPQSCQYVRKDVTCELCFMLCFSRCRYSFVSGKLYRRTQTAKQSKPTNTFRQDGISSELVDFHITA
eukprot:scaffold7387_cov408-Prasinococcus_capsulatus_cf.AAC.7